MRAIVAPDFIVLGRDGSVFVQHNPLYLYNATFWALFGVDVAVTNTCKRMHTCREKVAVIAHNEQEGNIVAFLATEMGN